MRLLLLLLLLFPRPLAGQSDSIKREGPFTPDTASEPSYLFTGHEDPVLLARIFQATYQMLMGNKAKQSAHLLCLGVGQSVPADAPAAVLEVLKDHLPVTSWSSCPRSARRAGRLLTITSLNVQGDTASAYAMDYAPPLGSSGWHCRAARAGHDWRVFYCSLRWIS